LESVTSLITGHSGGKSFQEIDCTGTDNQKQRNKTLHTPETTTKQTQKNLPS